MEKTEASWLSKSLFKNVDAQIPNSVDDIAFQHRSMQMELLQWYHRSASIRFGLQEANQISLPIWGRGGETAFIAEWNDYIKWIKR